MGTDKTRRLTMSAIRLRVFVLLALVVPTAIVPGDPRDGPGHDLLTIEPAISAEATDELLLPPYLDVVVFDIIRPSPEVEVAIFAPGALKPVTANATSIERVHVGDTLDTLVIHRPRAGRWTFRKSHTDAQVRILSQEFFPRGRLIEPLATVDQHARVQFGYSLRDSEGKPVSAFPQHPLSVDLLLHHPDSTKERFTMVPLKTSQAGVFRSTEKTTCRQAGRYWTEAIVRTIDSAGTPIEVFRDRWSGFSVGAAPPVLAAGRKTTNVSLADVMGISQEFRTALLLMAFLLTLAPYLAGVKIGGLEVPSLAARKRQAMKIAGPFAIAGSIALGFPIPALAPPAIRLRVDAIDATEAREIDVAISNAGSEAALLRRIELEVVKNYNRWGRPALESSARYRIPIDGLETGERHGIVVRHVIAPGTTERIVIAPETRRALDLRLYIHASDGTVLTADAHLGPEP